MLHTTFEARQRHEKTIRKVQPLKSKGLMREVRIISSRKKLICV